jgi:hypothetical protein
MKPNRKPGAGMSPPPRPSRHPEYSNAKAYNGDRSKSLGVDSPFVWNAVVIELPGATEPVFNLMLDMSAHRHERCAFVKHHFEGSGLPVPDNIVVLHKARGTIESDCCCSRGRWGRAWSSSIMPASGTHGRTQLWMELCNEMKPPPRCGLGRR